MLVRIYADDSCLGCVIKNEEDAMKNQERLWQVYLWEKDNNLSFNSVKFECMKSGQNTELKQCYNYMTPGAEELIEEKEVIRDLGVLMQEDCGFKEQVLEVTKRFCWN